MIGSSAAVFVETESYRRFRAFCDECRLHRCIGLCYGSSGVGKTLSARQYANWDKVSAYRQAVLSGAIELNEVSGSAIILCTLAPGPTYSKMLSEIWSWRHNLHQFLIEEVNRDERNQLNTLLQQGKDEEAMLVRHGHPTREKCEAIRKNVERLMYEAGWEYVAKRKRIEDPSELFIIDEADLLTDGALKEAITYFRRSRIGIVFLGTPKLCERLYRLPSVALSISAVHEFEPLSDTQVRQLFLDGWWTPRVSSRRHPAMDHESFMTIMEMTGGNFRRLYRLAQQIDHLIEVRRTRRITRKIVQAARKNLVFAAGVGS